MQNRYGEYQFDDDPARLDLDRVCRLLADTYWAAARAKTTVAASIAHSLPYGVYCHDAQVGFARVITDLSTIFWLCDVVIAPEHRQQGLGKQLVAFILSDPRLQGLNAFLATRDADGLYARFGFEKSDWFMHRPAPKSQNRE